MKTWKKVALGAAGAVALVAAAGFAWLIYAPARAVPVVAAGRTGQRINDGHVFGNFFPGGRPGRAPAVLLLGGSEGGLGADVRDEALLLQRAGFSVLHVAYFNVPGRPSHLDRIPLETFFDAIDWLRRRSDVNPSAIGIVGYSKGAEAALLVAANRADLKAVVAGMPSSVAWDALSMRGFILGSPSWTMADRPVPSLSYGSGDGKRELLPRFTNALRTVDRHPEVVIPVERVRGRMMLICGERDTLWPSCPMARTIVARVVAGGGAAPQLLDYPQAGHGVMGAPMPPQARALQKWTVLGGSAISNAAARSDGWPRIVKFLGEALGEGRMQARARAGARFIAPAGTAR